jgi:hypothetical protein
MNIIADTARTIREKAALLARTVRDQSAQVGRDIDSIREQIEKRKAERQHVAVLPVAKDIALAKLEEIVTSARNDKDASIVGVAQALRVPGSVPWIDAIFNTQRIRSLVAESLRTAVAAEIARADAKQPGITDGDREQQLKAIDEDLLHLELVEESIIRAAEESGMKIPRRPDADPRAVLAPAQDLP